MDNNQGHSFQSADAYQNSDSGDSHLIISDRLLGPAIQQGPPPDFLALGIVVQSITFIALVNQMSFGAAGYIGWKDK